MSHFYGTLSGRSRTKATRCGTKSSGIRVQAASWAGGIEVRVYHDAEAGVDRYAVHGIPWHGSGDRFLIAEGIVGKAPGVCKNEAVFALVDGQQRIAAGIADSQP